MKKPSLVSMKCLAVLFAAVWSVSPLWAQGHVSGNSTFGQVIPLPGHINEVVIDEARNLVYAGNFSAGRVEVVSMGTNQRISSFVTSAQPTAMVDMAMSLDNRFLVALSAPVTSGVSQLSSVTAVNLNDPVDRRHYPISPTPLAVTFAKNGEALIVTSEGMILFEPDTGAFRNLVTFADIEGTGAGSVSLPVPPPTFPREIVFASVDNNADGSVIFGATDEFIFSYEVGIPLGLMTIRTLDTLVNPPVIGQVSASDDGRYFLAGQLLFNRRLRVLADPPEADAVSDEIIGGTAIDTEANTAYLSFDLSIAQENLPGAAPLGILQLMDLHNLKLRTELVLPEQLAGRLQVDSTGNHLYAVGQSGLLYLPLDELADSPQMQFNPDDRRLFFQFDFCNRDSDTQTLRIETDGEPARFSLSVDVQRSSGRPAVLFEPHTGMTPADVRVTVDPGALGPVQGTSTFPVIVDTDAVNIPRHATVLANVRDVDQKGTLHSVPGHLVDITADAFRDRVYALDQENYQVLVFDSNFRLSGKIRTGNTPSWMLASPDGRYLVVANSRSETLTLIELNSLQVIDTIFLPWESMGGGFYPISIATDGSNILLSVQDGNEGQIAMLKLPFRTVSNPDTLGIFLNSFDPDFAVAGAPDGSGVLIAESSGGVHFWESLSSRITLSRSELGAASGAIGAGSGFFLVDNHVLNPSLVRIATLPGAEAGQESSGFAVLPDSSAVRSIRPTTQVDTGALQRHDTRDPSRLTNPVRMVEAPPEPSLAVSFSRTLTALRDGRLASTSSAGVVEFPEGFDATLQIPRVSAITNSADWTVNLGSGGLISIFGENLAGQTASGDQSPLPTRLGEACVTVNGANAPLLFVSPTQINAQLPFVSGNAGVMVHSAGGLSDVFLANVSPSAPAIFNVTANNSTFAAVFREDNKLATLSSPLRPDEIAVLYLTGLGSVTPVSLPGYQAPEDPLSITVNEPTVTFGGVQGEILFAGLTPGFVGLYQVNVRVPPGAPLGLEVPLTITGGGVSSTVKVRIVD